MATLIVAEHNNSDVAAATRNTATAAAMLPGPVCAIVIGHNCAEAVAQVAKIAGIETVLVADHPSLENRSAENVAEIIATQASAFTHVIAAATTFGKDLMPRVAALRDVMIVADIIAVEGEDTFVRPTYAGNIITRIKTSDALKVITARPTAFADPGDGDNAVIKPCDFSPSAAVSELLSITESTSERPELGAARIVVSGGRGVGSAENFRLITALADRLGAAVGASRAAVDAGFVPNDYQVGQTGKVVAPDLYIAVGISGAIQHLAGMKDSKVIVAINKDPDAPIFHVADYGLVGDLNQILPDLEAALVAAGFGS